MLWAQEFLEIWGWYADKLNMALRYQIFGEQIRDGSRDPSFTSNVVGVGCVKVHLRYHFVFVSKYVYVLFVV